MTEERSKLEASYDRVVKQFVDEFFDELQRKPFDRELLDQFAETVRGQGEVCEIGCGPGQIARYLKDQGVNMCGIDLSREMVEFAKRLNPDIPFQRGDMRSLEIPDASLDGIVCFYTIIHLKREDVTGALREMHRVLKPGGRLLVSFHGGEGELHRDEWYDFPVSIDISLFEREEMAVYLEAAGFEVERIVDREPYEFEYPTHRVYAFGKETIVSKNHTKQ
jgi:SAM-dependent methyltransferase